MITVGNYNTDGPYGNVNHLQARSGVYIILGRNAQSDRWTVVDIGEAGDVKSRVSNHDRADCWRRQNFSQLAVAVIYCDQTARTRIERELRAQFSPACGVY